VLGPIFSDCFGALWDNEEAIRVKVRYREWKSGGGSGACEFCVCVWTRERVCVAVEWWLMVHCWQLNECLGEDSHNATFGLPQCSLTG